MAGEQNGKVFTKSEAALLRQGLEVLRAQTERAIAKESDQVVIDARRRRVQEIRALMEMFV